jgi:hypothetical protein
MWTHCVVLFWFGCSQILNYSFRLSHIKFLSVWVTLMFCFSLKKGQWKIFHNCSNNRISDFCQVVNTVYFLLPTVTPIWRKGACDLLCGYPPRDIEGRVPHRSNEMRPFYLIELRKALEQPKKNIGHFNILYVHFKHWHPSPE